MFDLSNYVLSKEQVQVLKSFKVPLYHHFKTDKYYISTGYWHGIKPSVKDALLRVLEIHE